MPVTQQYLLEFPHPTGIVVNPSRRWIWFKICRTGGTSIIRRGLNGQEWITAGKNYQPKEFTQWLAKVTDEELKSYFVWTVVRNPWDRLISALAYFHVDPEAFLSDPITWLSPGFRSHLMPQHWYWQHADYIGHVETIQDSYEVICKRIGQEPATLDQMNKSTHGDYRSDIPERFQQLATALYLRDATALGYRFSDGPSKWGKRGHHV